MISIMSADLTPGPFAVELTHPSLITSSAKMQSHVSYSGLYKQTFKFRHKDSEC